MLRVATILIALGMSTGAYAQSTHHYHDMTAAPEMSARSVPTQPGQGAFAAIQEIVEILEADPKTDWSNVDIGALSQHLIDMDNVTLHARVQSSPIDGGIKFAVDGDGEVKRSIQRMVMAHAAIMNGVGGWKIAAAETDRGAVMSVVVPVRDLLFGAPPQLGLGLTLPNRSSIEAKFIALNIDLRQKISSDTNRALAPRENQQDLSPACVRARPIHVS